MAQVGQPGFVDGVDEAVISSLSPDGLYATVSLTDSDATWYGISIERFKSERRVLVPLPQVEGDAPQDDEDRTEKVKGAERVRARLSDPLPYVVTKNFIDHLHKEVKIRLLYRASVQDEVKSWFQENGLELPADIRPVKSDMQGVAGSVTFPAPEDTSILPQKMNYITRGKRLEVNNLPLVVSLLKLGFPLNSYAKL